MNMRPILLPLSLLFVCAWSEAVSIYKYRLRDGTILYSQTPGRRGVLLEVMHIPSSTPAQLAAQRRARQQLEADVARSERLTALRQQREAVCDVPVVAHVDASPRPGERTGVANGYSRLNERYWQRVHGVIPGTELVLDVPDPARTDYERFK